MIPVDQEFTLPGLNPGDRKGDCLRACVASLLELDLHDVPHFAEADDQWFGVLRDFIHAHSSGRYAIDCYEPTFPIYAGAPSDDVWPRHVIASGPSPRGPWWHAVLVDSWTGELAHDPHPDRTGILSVGDLLVVRAAS